MTDYEQSENQLQQALAMNQMLLDTLEKEREDRRRTRIISIVCAVICVVTLALFAGGVQIERTTETITQDTGEGNGNNVFQSGENASYTQEAKEALSDGEANN